MSASTENKTLEDASPAKKPIPLGVLAAAVIAIFFILQYGISFIVSQGQSDTVKPSLEPPSWYTGGSTSSGSGSSSGGGNYGNAGGNLGKAESIAAENGLVTPQQLMEIAPLEMPELEIPELPPLEMPELPKLELPELPELELPELSAPDTSKLSSPDDLLAKATELLNNS